jgi:hypothetical protein
LICDYTAATDRDQAVSMNYIYLAYATRLKDATRRLGGHKQWFAWGYDLLERHIDTFVAPRLPPVIRAKLFELINYIIKQSIY